MASNRSEDTTKGTRGALNYVDTLNEASNKFRVRIPIFIFNLLQYLEVVDVDIMITVYT